MCGSNETIWCVDTMWKQNGKEGTAAQKKQLRPTHAYKWLFSFLLELKGRIYKRNQL